MTRAFFDTIVKDVLEPQRNQIQEDFGRHIVEQRDRMASLVRSWIEGDRKFPIPIYDRLLDRLRGLDAATRADIASACLLMADQVVEAVLGTFDLGDDARADDKIVNYAIVAQFRNDGADEVTNEIDVNRGMPVIAIWNRYKRWLNRYARADLRPPVSDRGDSPEAK